MELVERYLQAIRFWLPREAKHDILAELSEDIHAQIEEREGGLGRKLQDAEVAAILKERGRPILVASAYSPQRSLIGPVLFPIYVFVLKIVGLCYLVPWVLVWIGLMLNSAYRAAHMGPTWLDAIGRGWGQWWTAAFAAAGVVTVVFAVLERVPERASLFENWDPLKLPRVRDANRIPRGSSTFEVVMDVVLLGWWAAKMGPLMVVNQPGAKVLLTPQWTMFFWGLLLVWLASALLAAVNVIRPYWTVPRAMVRLGLDVAGSGLFCWLMKVNIVAGIDVSGVSPERAAAIAGAINLWAARCFPAAVVAAVVIAAVDVFRIFRVRARAGVAGRAAISAAVVLLLLAGAGTAIAQVPPEKAADLGTDFRMKREMVGGISIRFAGAETQAVRLKEDATAK